MRSFHHIQLQAICAIAFLSIASMFAAPAIQTLDARHYHLRSGTNAEWDEFSASQPFGRRLDITFETTTNAAERTLLLWQDDVKQDWRVELNGKRLGSLFLMESPLWHALRVPPRSFRDGTNTISIISPRENDDIRVGQVSLSSESLESTLASAELEVFVSDENGTGSPCRLTVTDRDGNLAALLTPTNQLVAARPGVVYTAGGRARIGLRPGRYVVLATRGFEFSLDKTNVTLSAGEGKTVRLQLQREVPTPGLVSCDTHVHTFTYSKHGDATAEERAITLAGEGIELPIITDHDIAVDLQPAALTTRTRNFFTPVIGDEVTTRVGHFNIFPVKPDASLPSNRETNWTRLIDSFRATPGVQVVVFNHPRNVHTGFQPFARTNFNRVTGEARWPFDWRFDAMELINSSAMQSDFMSVFHDWFALLNAGRRITAVGSSDGHDVSRYIVGQGRTYIECDDAKPGALDVNAACRNLKLGRAYVSMGLLPVIRVNEHFGVGSLVTNARHTLTVSVEVRAPSWIQCDRIELFANGESVASMDFSSKESPSKNGIAARGEFKIPVAKHDQFLVAIATGPGDTAPHWPVSKPYQPNSPRWSSRVIGATNPIWVDGDGDGKFSSAREYAAKIVNENGDADRLVRALESFDEAVAIQTAAIARESGLAITSQEFKRALEAANPIVRKGFTKVIEESEGR